MLSPFVHPCGAATWLAKPDAVLQRECVVQVLLKVWLMLQLYRPNDALWRTRVALDTPNNTIHVLIRYGPAWFEGNRLIQALVE